MFISEVTVISQASWIKHLERQYTKTMIALIIMTTTDATGTGVKQKKNADHIPLTIGIMIL